MNTDLAKDSTIESTKELSKKVAIFNIVFGAIVVAGGIMGYFMAKSLPSLAAGMFFGNCLMLTIWGTDLFSDKSENSQSLSKVNTIGHIAAVVLSVALLIFFVIRLLKTGKPMPAVVIISFSTLAILANAFVLHKKSLLAN
ncbi:MAG: TMEM14 family protein [Candidatus Caenarcaniphilales bacterium]|nr:TMEM14 family protein [Candidatus Caenarcaniphilales bacterium]